MYFNFTTVSFIVAGAFLMKSVVAVLFGRAAAMAHIISTFVLLRCAIDLSTVIYLFSSTLKLNNREHRTEEMKSEMVHLLEIETWRSSKLISFERQQYIVQQTKKLQMTFLCPITFCEKYFFVTFIFANVTDYFGKFHWSDAFLWKKNHLPFFCIFCTASLV